MNSPKLVKFGATQYYCYSPKEAYCIHREIFENGWYDITSLPVNPFVIDAGANVGLFSVFVKQRYPLARIMAFEPAPLSFDALSRNAKSEQLQDVQIFNVCLSSEDSIATLTYLPNPLVNSTLPPKEQQKFYEESITKHGTGTSDSPFVTPYEVDIQLRRLSSFLDRQEGLNAIDLLKVSVEGVELDVLRGIDDVHWQLVSNVVVEMWEESGDLGTIEDLLQRKGFAIKTEAAPWAPKLYMITAKRNDETQTV